MHESDLAAVSNVEVYRSPLDIGGARVVGCLHNRSGETLEKLSLFYKQIGGEGFGGMSLEFEALKPGKSVPFTTSPIKWNEEDELEGYKLKDIGTGFNDNAGFDKPIEIKPAADRPTHKLESKCAGLKSDGGDSDFRLSHVQYENVKFVSEAQLYVVGCITNQSDEPIATDDRITKGGYKIDARHNYESGGGLGDLLVESPIPAGESVLFVYSNTFDEEKSGLSIEPEGGSMVKVE
jgi:hypothetical protein